MTKCIEKKAGQQDYKADGQEKTVDEVGPA
jgi:hypothetical protein